MQLSRKEKLLFIWSTIMVTGIMISYFIFSNYAINQGFNPSDEGVVLSQSWRLLNNEIPHKDFISIRPVGSGIIHQFDLILPFPLITTSRIIAAIEYIFISIAWAFLFITIFSRYITDNLKIIVYPSIILLTIIFNLNNGPIFTWTTTDALLFTTLAANFLFFFLYANNNKNKWFAYAFPAIFLFVCAALCRQTFALTAAISAGLLFLYQFNRKSIPYRLLWIVAGGTPVLLYFFYLIYHQAFNPFLLQMSGRTELIETGFITYGKSLLKDPYLITVFVGFLFIPFQRKIKQKGSRISALLQIYYGISLLVTAAASVDLFLGNNSAQYAFYFFWFTVMLLLHNVIFKQFNESLSFILISSLIISWTSSISIGDNSPRPFLGPLAVSTIAILIFHCANFKWLPQNISIRRLIIGIGTTALFVLSLLSMPKVNYRDWTSTKLNYTLQDIFPEMGKTKVNDNTRAYFEEFNRIYNQLNQPLHQFAMVPNNAFIYSIMQSKNPFTLDWMQHHEYIGAEYQFVEQISNAIKANRIYIFVDKVDSKLLYKGLLPFQPDLDFNHSYIPWLTDLCERLPIESPYFEVYVSKN